MKTRILMFGWEFPPFNSGGLGVACYGLTRALSQEGVDVIFVMPRKLDIRTPWAKMVYATDAPASPATGVIEGYAVNSILQPYMTAKSYRKWRFGMQAGESTSDEDAEIESGTAVYGWDLFSEVMRYRMHGAGVAQREQFDVIYAHDWLSFGAGIEAKRATGKPLIVHVHATEFDRGGGAAGVNNLVYAAEREGMEAADVVIAVSELTKSIIIQKYGIPAQKVRVVYNGIDEATTPQGTGALSRLRHLKQAGFSIVLFIGRLTRQKGPDYFLRAARRALAFNPKIMFVISGSGDMEGQVMKLAGELGIADRVFFTGFLDGADKHEVYAAADLFIMPSVSEPFGITSLEAMKVGTPVLVSRQSGVSEVVKHALKADFWDTEEMANKILSIVNYRGLAETLARNARVEAERLTWAQAAQKVNVIVHELVG